MLRCGSVREDPETGQGCGLFIPEGLQETEQRNGASEIDEGDSPLWFSGLS